MRVIVIDISGEWENIYETEINGYKDYYIHLKADLFDVVRLEWKKSDISIFVDDEGMLKPSNYGREVEGYPQPLFGNLVITGGVDGKGDTLPVPEWVTIKNIRQYVYDIKYVTKG